MQVQTNISSINPSIRKDQIGSLVFQNQPYLLSKFNGDKHIPEKQALEHLFDDINERILGASSVAESIIDQERGTVSGLVIAEPAPWESGIFGEPIGKIVLSLFDSETKSGDRAMVFQRIVEQLRVRMVSARVNLKDLRTIQALELEGAVLTDVLLTYRFDLERARPPRESSFKVGPARQTDERELKRMGRTIFTLDRFHNDQRLPPSKSDDAYEKWVSNSLHGFADCVLVARHNTEPIGFITCKIDRVGNGCKRGLIDLVGVDPSFSGRGIGQLLIHKALNWFENSAKVGSTYVGTQASNSHAIRMYEKTGFEHVDSEATVHLWSD